MGFFRVLISYVLFENTNRFFDIRNGLKVIYSKGLFDVCL